MEGATWQKAPLGEMGYTVPFGVVLGEDVGTHESAGFVSTR